MAGKKKIGEEDSIVPFERLDISRQHVFGRANTDD